MRLFTQTTTRALAALTFAGVAVTTQGAPLTGAGLLPIPSPNPATLNSQGAAYVSTGPNTQTGSWIAPAQTPWIGGDFTVTHASGQLPGSMETGTFRYNFTNLTNNGGELPVGTYFTIGDVDNGSANNEVFHMRAVDGSGNILTEWLDEPVRAAGSGLTAANMTPYEWDSVNQMYIFDGNTVPSNPSIAITMTNNQEMAYLELTKFDTHYGFGLAAPTEVPVPGAAILFGSALLGLAARKRAAFIA